MFQILGNLVTVQHLTKTNAMRFGLNTTKAMQQEAGHEKGEGSGLAEDHHVGLSDVNGGRSRAGNGDLLLLLLLNSLVKRRDCGQARVHLQQRQRKNIFVYTLRNNLTE